MKLKPNDILVSTFGYDARLATFWKVLKVTPKQVQIAEIIDQNRTGDWMAGTAMPDPNGRIGTPIRKKFTTFNGHTFVHTNYGIATLWDGEAVKTYNHH